MAKGERSALGEVFFFPFDHPAKTARAVALGSVAFVGTMLGAQASMILAEHGAIYRPRPTMPEGEENYEQ